MEKHKIALAWTALVMGFILAAGFMIGQASSNDDRQRLQISIECIKAGGSPQSTEHGGIICTTTKK